MMQAMRNRFSSTTISSEQQEEQGTTSSGRDCTIDDAKDYERAPFPRNGVPYRVKATSGYVKASKLFCLSASHPPAPAHVKV